jgi:hypothetical protein
MDICLKNIIATKNVMMTADISLDNKIVGFTFNRGDGSSTQYLFFEKEIESKLESYCDTLPKEVVYLNENKVVEIKMTIEKLIDNLVNKIT